LFVDCFGGSRMANLGSIDDAAIRLVESVLSEYGIEPS